MINYKQAKNILKKAKIKIEDEEISIKNSLNRVVAKDIFSPSKHIYNENILLSFEKAVDYFLNNIEDE